MARDRSLVRASDIGAYTYCRRAWYLAQVRGVAHEQPQRLARGSQAHAQHGRRVQRASRLQQMGLWLAVAGLLGVLFALALWALQAG